MENKNTIYIVAALVLGVLVGYLIWGKKGGERSMHMMPDGTMMHDENMSMDAMMHDMMSELEGKKGDEFDKAFIEEMIVHHEGAVAMAESAKINAKHQEIKTLAEGIIKAQNAEIAKMQMWLKDWYGVGSNPPNSAEGAPNGSIHNLPVPAGVSSAKTALATRLNISESKILILEALDTEWPDSCLGIQEQGVSCAQVITPGYNVLMQANGKEYRYRTNVSGSVVKADE
jgi:hypothetical protein